MIQAKIENRAPEVVVATEGKPETAVVNIMAALKKSMEAKGRTKVRDAVRKRMGKQPEEEARTNSCAAPTEHTSHGALIRLSHGASGGVQW